METILSHLDAVLYHCQNGHRTAVEAVTANKLPYALVIRCPLCEFSAFRSDVSFALITTETGTTLDTLAPQDGNGNE